ncbi:MAG: polyprenyl synthetase family protein [Calditrichia bacterium]|nr:polyprenyl synthetase family protein [Calditrichia bacterium]
MFTPIDTIKKILKDDIKKYNHEFSSIMSSDVAIVDKIAKYIVRHKGKGFRPLLVLMSARLSGPTTKATYALASVVEILHTATLVHDDVVDDASVRRGFPSINAMWKNKISVLMGDYLLAKSLIGATESGKLEYMNVLANTSKRLSKGELLQIEKSRRLNITEEEYFKIVSDKTAALISACCELGALSVDASAEKVNAMKQYGENLGIAFQIKDDLLDYEGNQNIVGKPVGADLKEKKITLPLLLSFKNAPDKEKKYILKFLKKGVNNHDIKHILKFCDKYEGITKSLETAQVYADKAKASLEIFPDNEYKEVAEKFVDYVISRKK